MGGYFAIGNSSIANDLSILMHEYSHFVISQIVRNGRGVNFCTGENGEIPGAIEESLADIFSVLMRMSVPGPHVIGSSGEAWKIGELALWSRSARSQESWKVRLQSNRSSQHI